MTAAILLTIVAVSVVLMLCLLALIGQVRLLTCELAKVAIWTRSSVVIAEHQARATQRLADALGQSRRDVETRPASSVTAIVVPVGPHVIKH